MSAHNRLRREASRRVRLPSLTALVEGRTDEERLTRGLALMAEHGRCQLCDGPPDFVGLFFPSPELQRRLLAPPGKDRVVAFALCGACWALPGAMDRVDAAIVALADSMAGDPGSN